MKIYAAKGRPSDNPLIVHIAEFDKLAPIVAEVPEKAKILAEKYWPGPLTMILPKSDLVPQETTGGLDSVAVRFPSDRIAQELMDTAKKLIERLEQEAVRRGQRAVIAVCNPEGNPVAVHVMDGAFLVSFDVAMKKAYTAVAVKMSTMELSKIAQPGGTFYGVDKLDGGKIVIFGGGIPLKSGNTIIGGLGISGGTGEEDHSLAEYGQSVLNEIL